MNAIQVPNKSSQHRTVSAGNRASSCFSGQDLSIDTVSRKSEPIVKMLSRIAVFRPISATSARLMSAKAATGEEPAARKHEVTLLGKNNPDSVFYVGPERDLVNFPRRKRPIESPPVRLGFLPEEWFTQFHVKTGVTGPYMFLASFGTFLISKEIYVLEHEFYTGIGLFLVGLTIIKGAGPAINSYVHGEMDKDEAKLKAIRQVSSKPSPLSI